MFLIKSVLKGFLVFVFLWLVSLADTPLELFGVIVLISSMPILIRIAGFILGGLAFMFALINKLINT